MDAVVIDVGGIPWGTSGYNNGHSAGYLGNSEGHRGKLVRYRGKSAGYRGIPWEVGGVRETVCTVGYRGKSVGYRAIPWEVSGMKFATTMEIQWNISSSTAVSRSMATLRTTPSLASKGSSAERQARRLSFRSRAPRIPTREIGLLLLFLLGREIHSLSLRVGQAQAQ